MQAYKVCKTRLDAVQATLSQYFESDPTTVEATASNGDGKARRPKPPVDSEADEDDIPF